MKDGKVEVIGQKAVFYVPANKLDETMKATIHDFCIENFNAYTKDLTHSYGVWRRGKDSELVEDQCVRYEVSFDTGMPQFLDFLSHLCRLMGEECIYLTMKDHGYLIKP